MKLSNLAKPAVAVSLLAVLATGCAQAVEDDQAPLGTTQQEITGAEGVSIASGVFGIVNGAFTAYVTLDSFIRYGAPSANDKIIGDLATANAALRSLQSSQAEQFRQLKVDNIILTLNDLESKVDTAWGEYKDSADKANFVPSDLKWSDFDMLTNRLASTNGTTDAFALIKDGMLQASGAIADDPLGTYALRMRTRLSQAAFLLTVKTPITASEQTKVDAAVKRLEFSFAKATRAYFVAKIAPALATSNTSECYPAFWGGWAYDTPGDNTNGGWTSEGQCFTDRKKWSTLTLVNSRQPITNRVWSEQDALATGKWKRSAGTVVVKSATVTRSFGSNDLTKEFNLVCNSVENCSIPPDVQLSWLGGDPMVTRENDYSVTYSCGDDKGDRQASFSNNRTIVLACNVQAAVSGVYRSTAHDASPGRGPDDTLFVESAAPEPADPQLGNWTYRTADETQPALWMFNDSTVWDCLRTSGGSVEVVWNQDGHVTRIGRPGGKVSEGFDFISPALDSLPTVPQQ